MRAVVGRVEDERIVLDSQFLQLGEHRPDILVVVDHRVGVGPKPAPGLTQALRLGMGAEMHMREVHPDEHGLARLRLLLDEVGRAIGDVIVDRLHPLLGQWAGVLDGLRAIGVGEAVDHAARAEILAEVRKFRIVGLRIIGKLRLFLRVEVIEIAVEFVEPMRGGQKLILVAEMILAELAGGIALGLQQFGDGRIFLAQAEIGARQARPC